MRNLNDVKEYFDEQDLAGLPEFLIKQLNINNSGAKFKIIKMYKEGTKQCDIVKAMKGICSKQYVSEVLKKYKAVE